MPPPGCPSQYKGQRFNLHSDLQRRSVFIEQPVENWTFPFYKRNHSAAAAENILQHYIQDLAWLKEQQLPEDVKTFVSRLKAEYKNLSRSDILEMQLPATNPEPAANCIFHGPVEGFIYNDKGNVNAEFHKRSSTPTNDDTTPAKRQRTTGDKEADQACDDMSSPTSSLPSIDSAWDINSDDDFWQAYLKLLQSDIPHNLSLERVHIIQCGFSILCDPRIPSELHEMLSLKGVTSRVCSQVLDYLRPYLEAARTGDLDTMIEAATTVTRINVPTMRAFFREILVQFPGSVFGNTEDLKMSEAAYNHLVIWPIIGSISSAITGTHFVHGETRLEAISNNCNGDGLAYKADGILKIRGGLELLILETSGEYDNSEKHRHGFDHVKGAFGSRMMLRSIYNTYYYGGQAATSLSVYFALARGKKLHIWSLSMPTSGIMVMDRIISLKLPVEVVERDVLLDMLNQLWSLKVLLSQSVEVINTLREEHINVMERLALGDDTELPIDLRTTMNADVLKPTKQAGTAELLPDSDPLLQDEDQYVVIRNVEDV